ncbi:MAG: hypothetical protein OXI15_01405 [Chromatiales bacterium]|nr:hypothetical protein [Chromatiales bacterium]
MTELRPSAADMKHRFAAVSAALVALALSFPASGETGGTVQERFNRFQLYANCEPMNLIVEELHPVAADIGLKLESIVAAAESRLRSARLYRSAAMPYLYVNVILTRTAFGIRLEYNKSVFDAHSGEVFSAATWLVSSAGSHGSDSSYIMSAISEHLDQFLVEYLRVNEEACERR